MTREVGLPRKKRYFDLLTAKYSYGNCILDKQILWIACSYDKSENVRSFKLLNINLDQYGGNEEATESFFREDNIEGPFSISMCEEKLILKKNNNFIIASINNMEIIFNEDDVTDVHNWKSSYNTFLVENFYYRQVDRENLSKGIDIVDINTCEICGHLSVDLDFSYHIEKKMLAGKRPNGNFAIFSIDQNCYIFELDSQKYFNCIPTNKIHFAQSGNNLVLGCNDSVVLLDLDKLEVVKHINCLQNESIKSAIKKYNSHESKLTISDIVFAENRIIVNGGRRISYVMCIEITETLPSIKWVTLGFKDSYINYVGGDLIFGVYKSRPVAWDVYNGEMVWDASAGTIANKIQVGDGWVVYSAPAGHIQCFKWHKPYISPHRPAE